MCGIVGTLGWIPPSLRRESAIDSLAPRGPDGRGAWLEPEARIWLGHRRLAIQDLSESGAQPMRHPQRPDLILTYNGEIYNYADLRRKLEAKGCRIVSTGDTELILHAYTVWGDKLVDEIEGMFALVLWDGEERRAFLARDPVGQKPLYFRRNGSQLSFASTSNAIRSADPSVTELSPEGLGYVLTLGYVPSPYSVWRGIECLPPGHCASWTSAEGLKIRKYWEPPDRLDGAQDAETFKRIFPKICREHMISDVPVGLMLSGGLDSTCVAKTLVDLGVQNVNCVTLNFVGSDNSEAAIAQDTAKLLNFNHQLADLRTPDINQLRVLVASSAPEPQGYSALLTWYLVSERMSETGKVVLTGDGGDELFGGYAWYRDLYFPTLQNFRQHLTRRVPLSETAEPKQRRKAMRAFSKRSVLHRHAMRQFPRFLPEEAAQLFAPLSSTFDEEAMLEPLNRAFLRKLPLQAALQRVDLMTFCSGSIMAKTDRMSMAHSLEVRAPFLDRRIVDWALSHRAPTVLPGGEKRVVREALKGAVPDSVLSQPKQGFSMRGMESFDFAALEGEIERSHLVRDGLLRNDFRRYTATGAPFREARLWTLAAIATWYDQQSPSNIVDPE